MPYKKLIIIIIAIILVIGGVVVSSLLFPRQEPAKIDPPLNLSQTTDNFNSLASQTQSNLNIDNISNQINSSSSVSISSSRSALTDVKQAVLKTFDENTSFIALENQDFETLSSQIDTRNLSEDVLMYQDPTKVEPNNFYFFKIKDQLKYIGKGIRTVEKITINDKSYWFIVQVNIFGEPNIVLFNDIFTSKVAVEIPDEFLFSSIKSVSNTNAILNLKNGNGRDIIISEYNINLADYTTKLATI